MTCWSYWKSRGAKKNGSTSTASGTSYGGHQNSRFGGGYQPTTQRNDVMSTPPNHLAPSDGRVHQTPPGFNKGRRDVARSILCLVAATLLWGMHMEATCFSAAAVLCLKEGTFCSIKNMKWMALSGISFCASLLSMNLESASDAIDEDRAYGMKMFVWLAAKMIQSSWGITLALFLFSSYCSQSSEDLALRSVAGGAQNSQPVQPPRRT